MERWWGWHAVVLNREPVLFCSLAVMHPWGPTSPSLGVSAPTEKALLPAMGPKCHVLTGTQLSPS